MLVAQNNPIRPVAIDINQIFHAFENWKLALAIAFWSGTRRRKPRSIMMTIIVIGKTAARTQLM